MAKTAAFRPKRILVHLDTTSERHPALTRALHLAQATGGSLRLVEVLVPLPRHTPNAADLESLLRKEMKDRLVAAAGLAKQMGVPVTSELLCGDLATMLVEASVSWRADVLLRSHGIHQATPGPIGPTDSQLVRRCPCPVWFVTTRHAEGERVIVAAVDPDPEDGPRHLLSVRVVQAAVAVAEASGATLHIVHVWTAYGHQVLASHTTAEDLVGYVEACRDSAKRRFSTLLHDARVPAAAKTHLIEGQGDQALAAFIEKRRADLVVLGTVGRTGLAGLVVGNTAERVLRQVRCSVLAFKPAGFAEAMVERRVG
jgi:nucleotide-binding universal stress UspA family protein